MEDFDTTLGFSLNKQVHVVWNLRSSRGGDPGTTGLKITPLEADVPEGGSLPFRVEVFPTKGNCYFAEEAEAFVSPANQMTFRFGTCDPTLKDRVYTRDLYPITLSFTAGSPVVEPTCLC